MNVRERWGHVSHGYHPILGMKTSLCSLVFFDNHLSVCFFGRKYTQTGGLTMTVWWFSRQIITVFKDLFGKKYTVTIIHALPTEAIEQLFLKANINAAAHFKTGQFRPVIAKLWGTNKTKAVS